MSPQIYYYISTGYEGDYERRLGNNYKNFCNTANKLLHSNLVHIDGTIKKGYQDAVNGIYRQVGGFSYGPSTHDVVGLRSQNPLFVVNDNDMNTFKKIIGHVKELDYSRFFGLSDVAVGKSLLLENGDLFVIVKIDAESG